MARRSLLILLTFLLPLGLSCPQKAPERALVRTYLDGPVKTLDPARAEDAYSTTVLAQMMEPLLQYAYLDRPFRLEGRLAELPVGSEDGLTYTFRLKEGIRFQDDPCFPGGRGRAVKASDVVASWLRLADPAVASPWWGLLRGKIEGLDAYHEALAAGKTPGPVTGLAAPDARTLVVRLTHTYPTFPHLAAAACTAVVAPEAVRAYGAHLGDHPVGTGPFRLKTWERGQRLLLERSPSFRRETYPRDGSPDGGQPLPLSQGVEFRIFREKLTRWQHFLKGDLDLSGVPREAFGQALKDGGLHPALAQRGIVLHKATLLNLTYWAFNMRDPVVGSSLELRRAMSLALDRQRLVEVIYGGEAQAAQGPIPPGLSGYDPGFVNPWARRDIKGARALLDQAGLPPGLTLTLDLPQDTTSRQMGELFAQDMASIGLKIELRTSTWARFRELTRTGGAQIWPLAWDADYADGENFLQLFHGPNAPPGPNGGAYANAAFDALFVRAQATMDPGERERLYRRMARIVADDCPVILGVHRQALVLVQPRVKNAKPHMAGQYADPQGTVKYLGVGIDAD